MFFCSCGFCFYSSPHHHIVNSIQCQQIKSLYVFCVRLPWIQVNATGDFDKIYGEKEVKLKKTEAKPA